MIRLELARTEDAGDPYAFHTGPQDYVLRWPDGAFEPARLVWTDELQQELAAVGRDDHDPALARRLGDRLHRFLAATRFAGLAAELRAAVVAGRPVQLDIVAAAAELYALPWELLTPGDGRPLGETPGLHIRYAWPGTSAAPSAAPREGGRVLLAWSHAFGNVGEAHTIQALAAACHAGFVAWEPARDVLADASLGELVATLERRLAEPDPPTILHLLAHGAADGERYGLGLHDGRGGREVVDAAAVRRALAPFAPRLRLVVLMACDSGNPGPPGAHLGSAVQELHRAGFATVIGSRYPLTGPGALEFTRAFYHHLLEETASVDAAFAAARVGLARGRGLDWASLQLYRPLDVPPARPIVFRPHRGLLAFEREHARFFFGRDPERREALSDLQALVAAGRPRLLVVAGASGTGKSSVVLAGLVPEVLALGWRCLVLRPGAAPLRALAETLAQTIDDPRPLLLVIDQFEEVFTHAPADDRLAFARRLWDMSQSTDGRTRVVLTLRVDYLGRCGELTLDDAGLRLDHVAYDEAHRVFVAQMTADRLTATITGPSARLGLTLEPGLPARLLHEIGGDPVGLPLLQYALDELWQRRSDDTLTHAALDAIGGVHGALARHADAVIDRLGPPEQSAARRLLVHLVAYGPDRTTGTRRRADVASLRPDPPGPFDDAVTALIAARLLVRRTDEHGDEHATLEVAHEALIRHWDRLWRWYEEARANLTRRAELAAIVGQAREHGEHLTGNRLVHAEALARGLGDDLDPQTRDFLQTSRVAADRARRTRRRATLTTWVGLIGGLALVTFLAVRASVQSSNARNAAHIGAALSELQDHPHVAAALLLAADDPDIPQWREIAAVATQTLLPTDVLTLEGVRPSPLSAAALSPDGAEVVTGSRSGAVRIWPRDPRPQDTVLTLDPGRASDTRPVHQLLVQPDGDAYTILAAHDDDVILWRRDAAGVRRVLAHPIASGPPLEFKPSAQFVRSPRTGRIIELHDQAETHLWEPAGAALAPRPMPLDCQWFDGAGEQMTCAFGQDQVQLLPWSGGPATATLARVPFVDQPIGPAATLTFHRAITEGNASHIEIADLENGRVVYVDESPRNVPDSQRAIVGALLSARDLVWLNARGTLCQRARATPDQPTCAPLPPDCDTPRLANHHPELGALIECRGSRPRVLFAAAVGYGPARVRLEVTLPDNEAAALLLTADSTTLIAAAHSGALWQWDLRQRPSGFLPLGLSAATALIPGTAGILDVAFTSPLEIRHTRWSSLLGEPTISRTTHPFASDTGLYPAAVLARATDWIALLLPPETLGEPREHATPPGDALLLSGGLPLAPPSATPIAASLRSNVLATTPDGSKLLHSIGTHVQIVDRGAPTTPRLQIASPVDADGQAFVLQLAALHRSGAAAAVAWNDASDLLLAAGVTSTIPAPGPACGPAESTSYPVTALTYSDDGRALAVGRDNGRIELLPLSDTGAVLPTPSAILCSRTGAPKALTFTADGHLLAGTDRGELIAWTDPWQRPGELRTDEFVVRVPGRPPIHALTVTDEHHILALTSDSSYHLWFTHDALTVPALRDRLAATTRVCLTPAERAAFVFGPDPDPTCPGRHVLRDTPIP